MAVLYIGAAIGLIKVRAIVEITGAEGGGYLIHHEGDPVPCESGPKAIGIARNLALEAAQKASAAMGGHEVELDVKVERIDIPGMGEDISLVAATVTAQVISEAD